MRRRLLVLLMAWGCLSEATAAEESLLNQLTQKALLTNPDVLSHWHDFNAATQEIRVARGGYLPKVDLSSNAGNERLTSPLSQFYTISSNFYRDTTTVTLTQMLYDGFMTRDEVRRLNHVQLSRYFEWLDSMENSALETAQSYFDLVRHKALYRLSEENFVSHRVVYEQILLKVKAGVGRAVDLEQIKGRLALSESNLVTDNSSVQDANARLLRLVNEMPKREDDGTPDMLVKKIPSGAVTDQLASAINDNPAVLAAVENVRAAQSDLDERRGKYQPKLDVVLSDSRGKNVGGVLGQNRDAVAQVVMSWNLFNGGSDAFRANQYTEQLQAARYKRDKACRDARQQEDLAYHGVGTLTEQLGFLAQRRDAIEKARYAYKKQFDLGQRSLLDLLDSENELYQSQRAYVNAIYDRAIDAAKALAGMGKLVSTLGLTPMNAGDVAGTAVGAADRPESCPALASASLQDRKQELIDRAREELQPVETRKQLPLDMPPSSDKPEIIKIPVKKSSEKASAPADDAKTGNDKQ
ncbi:MAG: TolC family outer membrane protein [Betaproteobacteria bacterium]|nr:TolC family outer membrane protein [Betaproteobacteria bacterium]